MKVFILSVYFCMTRETIPVGVYSTEENANKALREFRMSRENDKEKYSWENWSLTECILDGTVSRFSS